jgi:hypothetical protein
VASTAISAAASNASSRGPGFGIRAFSTVDPL